ncbi:MAG: hypothetical protein ACOYXR_11920 [Nitrospirota bacterium]
MTACLCGLLVATLSAASADLETTRQFTANGQKELNPLARPFVEGRGARGEAWLGSITVATYVTLGQAPEPWRTLALFGGWAVHTTMAIRNVRIGTAHEVPRIVFPVLAVRW